MYNKYDWKTYRCSIEVSRDTFLKSFSLDDKDILEHGKELTEQIIGYCNHG